MGRPAKPPKKKAEAKRPLAGRSAKSEDPKVGDLEKRLTEALAVKTEALKREVEALEQQAATAEILRVISRSPADLQSVFDAIVDSAMRLFRAWSVNVCRFDGELVHLVATRGGPGEAGPSIRGRFPTAPTGGLTVGRCILDRAVIQIDDVEAEVGLVEATREMARARGWRSALAVPMLRDGEPIGAIMVTRRAPGGFEAGSVELLQTFADQAVIAIENVRLYKEQEARNRDLTATSQILQVISSSPTDVQPVFDAIVESAARLCDAVYSTLATFDGELMDVVAAHNWSPAAWAAARRRLPARPERGLASGRAILERAVVHIPDVGLDQEYDNPEIIQTVGFRNLLAVPMMRDDKPIGVILVGRAEPGRFADSHVELLKTFADQAVIAIENARLFTELEARNREVTEALERQVATGAILRAISQSPTDTQPVFETIARNGVRVIGAGGCTVFVVVGDQLHLVATDIDSPAWAAQVGPLYPAPIDADLPTTQAIRERRVVHLSDIEHNPEVRPKTRQVSLAGGYRTVVFVPMLRGDVAVGAVGVARTDPAPFSDRQVELLQTFADQAVIAIENVRLFTELGARNVELVQSLDRQTATAEILRAISQSQTDVQPVFEAIAESAIRLLGAWSAIVLRYEAGLVQLVAARGGVPGSSEVLMEREGERHPLDEHNLLHRTILTRTAQQIVDVETEETLGPALRERARLRGWRSSVLVPMLRGDSVVGVISITRAQPGAFSPDDIALLQTFADQAVIAIENGRLLGELQARNAELTESLEQQTATSEVLKVISRSAFDLQPVFETLAENAVRLCDARRAFIFRVDGEVLRAAASYNASPELIEAVRANPIVPGRHSVTARAALERRTVHIADVQADPEFSYVAGRVDPVRTMLSVPMLTGNVLVGVMTIFKLEVAPFTAKQIALVETFADQAVIAIENVRLFTELQASNRELTSALDTQTATSDILRVISRSQTDVQTVFDTILGSAVRLLRGYTGALTRVVGDQIELAAHKSTDAAAAGALRSLFPRSLQSGGPAAQTVRDRAPINIADQQMDPQVPEPVRVMARVSGHRSVVWVPLLHHNEAIGAIGVTRREPGGFTDDEIALLQTFADQAVIAIENARLLTELQARTHELTRSVEQLTALGDVGRAVSSSLDLDTVLTTIVGRAVQLSGTDGGTIFEYDEGAEEFSPRATLNADESQSALLRATRLRRGEGAVGQMAVTREPLQIPDIAAEGAYDSRLRGALLEAGTRAVLAVPLLHEGRIVGGLVVTRRTPGAFTTEIVEILRTFATQSALAIQNARLFREIERKSRELEVASQHKSEFLANMSHELRTPLNAIIGYSELLEEEAGDLDGGRLVPDLQKIATAAKHQLSLINDILDLSKIEAGRMELELAEFDLPSAVENALILVRERASRRGISLGHTVDSGLGMVRADERKVKQVLLNLLSNALKFTPEGGRVDVRARVRDDFAEISVADTGVGIAPEDQEAVFEEFRQVGAADRKVEGSGLGLALSRKFVELHGGRIWVRSQVGEGSTFTFTLPVRRDEMGA